MMASQSKSALFAHIGGTAQKMRNLPVLEAAARRAWTIRFTFHGFRRAAYRVLRETPRRSKSARREKAPLLRNAFAAQGGSATIRRCRNSRRGYNSQRGFADWQVEVGHGFDGRTTRTAKTASRGIALLRPARRSASPRACSSAQFNAPLLFPYPQLAARGSERSRRTRSPRSAAFARSTSTPRPSTATPTFPTRSSPAWASSACWA